ncbi:MAG: hypothetical protein RLZZ303_1950 [Candidatus Hydrogenedentota bacterium]|jgi:uncharacterized membrane protein
MAIATRLLIALALFGTTSLAAAEEVVASSSPLALTLLMRWTHVLSAIAMMGGTLFIWMVLRGAVAESLDGAAREALVAAVRKRWKRAVMILTTLLLVSGFYNYLMVTRFEHPDEPRYHMMFGIKFLLSMAVFTLAMFMIGSTGLAKRLQKNESVSLAILLALAAAVVAVGGYMKVM